MFVSVLWNDDDIYNFVFVLIQVRRQTSDIFIDPSLLKMPDTYRPLSPSPPSSPVPDEPIPVHDNDDDVRRDCRTPERPTVTHTIPMVTITEATPPNSEYVRPQSRESALSTPASVPDYTFSPVEVRPYKMMPLSPQRRRPLSQVAAQKDASVHTVSPQRKRRLSDEFDRSVPSPPGMKYPRMDDEDTTTGVDQHPVTVDDESHVLPGGVRRSETDIDDDLSNASSDLEIISILPATNPAVTPSDPSPTATLVEEPAAALADSEVSGSNAAPIILDVDEQTAATILRQVQIGETPCIDVRETPQQGSSSQMGSSSGGRRHGTMSSQRMPPSQRMPHIATTKDGRILDIDSNYPSSNMRAQNPVITSLLVSPPMTAQSLHANKGQQFTGPFPVTSQPTVPSTQATPVPVHPNMVSSSIWRPTAWKTRYLYGSRGSSESSVPQGTPNMQPSEHSGSSSHPHQTAALPAVPGADLLSLSQYQTLQYPTNLPNVQSHGHTTTAASHHPQQIPETNKHTYYTSGTIWFPQTLQTSAVQQQTDSASTSSSRLVHPVAPTVTETRPVAEVMPTSRFSQEGSDGEIPGPVIISVCSLNPHAYQQQ